MRFRTSVALMVLIPMAFSWDLKVQEKLDDKYDELRSRSRDITLIHLSKATTFQRFLVQQPRNYDAFVLFAPILKNQGRFTGYTNRKNARLVLGKIAKSYYDNEEFIEKPVFFFDTSPQMAENLSTILGIHVFPSLLYFPKEGSLDNVVIADGYEVPFKYHRRVLAYVEKVAGIELGVHKSTDNLQNLFHLFMFAAVAAVVYQKQDSCTTLTQNLSRNLPNYCLITIVLLISGHVYNYVAGPAPIGSDRDGSLVFFARSRRYQYQVEAYIISILYFLYSVGMLFVIEGRRNFLEKNKGMTYSLIGFGIFITGLSHFLWTLVQQIKTS